MRVSVFLLLSGFLFAACNNEIFVDKLSVSVSQATMHGDGDSITVDVMGTDWWATVLNPAASEIYSTYLSGKVYDANGTDMGWDNSCSGLGKLAVTYTDDVYNLSHDISLIRTDHHALKIVLGKNYLTDEDFDITIRIFDYFSGAQDIHLSQLPGSGYVFGSMTYTLVEGSCRKAFEDVGSGAYISSRDEPADVSVSVFLASGEDRRIAFKEQETSGVWIAEGAFGVQLPAPDATNGLQYLDETVPYTREPQTLLVSLPSKQQTLTAQPGVNYYRRILEYVSYEAEYTLTLYNTRDGKPYLLRGTFTSKSPTGEGYVIWE